MNVPINQRDKWSPIPVTEEPVPTEEEPEAKESETVKNINVTYPTLIALSALLIIIGATLSTATMFAIYGPAISRGNLIFETDDQIKKIRYNTEVIRGKVLENQKILPVINGNIEKIANGIVEELKPKEAKIINR